MADLAVRLGPAPPRDSYLRADAVLQTALDTGAGALHPGYGFLSEDAALARSIEAAGLIFFGPTPSTLELFGSKHRARNAALAAGVSLRAGTDLLVAWSAMRSERGPAGARSIVVLDSGWELGVVLVAVGQLSA
jgi:urea carboxylase